MLCNGCSLAWQPGAITQALIRRAHACWLRDTSARKVSLRLNKCGAMHAGTSLVSCPSTCILETFLESAMQIH